MNNFFALPSHIHLELQRAMNLNEEERAYYVETLLLRQDAAAYLRRNRDKLFHILNEEITLLTPPTPLAIREELTSYAEVVIDFMVVSLNDPLYFYSVFPIFQIYKNYPVRQLAMLTKFQSLLNGDNKEVEAPMEGEGKVLNDFLDLLMSDVLTNRS